MRGFSLLELLISLALVGTISAIALPAYWDTMYLARVAQAATDIGAMGLDLQRYKELNGEYPATLADAGLDDWRDPWGQPYQYLRLEGAGAGVQGQARKDRFLVPLNSDFDLYSIGEDGATVLPLTGKAAHDDIVRANDGLFVGLGADY